MTIIVNTIKSTVAILVTRTTLDLLVELLTVCMQGFIQKKILGGGEAASSANCMWHSIVCLSPLSFSLFLGGGGGKLGYLGGKLPPTPLDETLAWPLFACETARV